MDKIEKLVLEYRNNVIKQTESIDNADHKSANKAYSKVMKAFKSLISLGEDHRLLALLEDERPDVRCWAAAHCLELNESESLKVLENLENSMFSFTMFAFTPTDAKYTIIEWKKGKLRFRAQA